MRRTWMALAAWLVPCAAMAADWQYPVPFDPGKTAKDGKPQPGRALLWLPPETKILHIKSGNFHQADHLPPTGSLAGIPLLAMNGQFETYGPEGGLRPEYGRETQWVFVEKDIQRFRERDPNHLMSLWLDLGGDHFHGSPELAQYAALFIRKTAKYRLQPPPVPLGKDDANWDRLPACQGSKAIVTGNRRRYNQPA